MSTDNADGTSMPKLLGFRPTQGLVNRLNAWKRQYASRAGVAEDSITMQFALPYLVSLGLGAEGVPNGSEQA